MIRTNIYNAISGACLLIGIGGLGGACDTGKGFVLSIILIATGSVMELLSGYTKKEPNPEAQNCRLGSKEML